MTWQVDAGSVHKTDDVGGSSQIPCTKRMSMVWVDAGPVTEVDDVAGRRG
jgi:hypothetical protein